MTWEVSRLAVDGRLVLVARGLVVFAGAAVGFGAARLSDIKRLLDRSPG